VQQDALACSRKPDRQEQDRHEEGNRDEEEHAGNGEQQWLSGTHDLRHERADYYGRNSVVVARPLTYHRGEPAQGASTR